jgi:hypothetical protein
MCYVTSQLILRWIYTKWDVGVYELSVSLGWVCCQVEVSVDMDMS